MPSQRALIGLVGSLPGMTLPASLPAHGLLGTCQAGLIALLAIVYWPAGVSRPTCPTAIPKLCDSLRFLNRRSRYCPRLTTITVAYLRLSSSVVTFGWVWCVRATNVREAVVDVIALPIWRFSELARIASPSTPGGVLTPAPEISTCASLA